MRVKATCEDGSSIVLTSLSCIGTTALVLEAQGLASGKWRMTAKQKEKTGQAIGFRRNLTGQEGQGDQVVYPPDEIMRECEEKGRPALLIALKNEDSEGVMLLRSVIVGWTFYIARDQEAEAEPIESWAQRLGTSLSLLGLFDWVSSDAEEAALVRSRLAQDVIGDDDVEAREQAEAVQWLASKSLARLREWQASAEHKTRFSEDLKRGNLDLVSVSSVLRDVLADELRSCSYEHADDVSLKESHSGLWLHRNDDGWFRIPLALEALIRAWWESDERAAWKSRKTSALPDSVMGGAARLFASTPNARITKRHRDLARSVVRESDGIAIYDEAGPVARTIPAPVARLAVIEAATAKLETEIAHRVFFELVSQGASGRIDVTYEGFRGLAEAIGAPWNSKTRETLKGALEAMRAFESDWTKHSGSGQIRGLITYSTATEHDGFSRRETDSLTITLSAVLRPLASYGSKLVPCAPLPNLACGQKSRPRWANLCIRIAVLMSERSDESFEKRGVILTSPQTVKRLSREARIEPDDVRAALESFSTGEDPMLERSADGRFQYGAGPTYRPYREFIEDQGRRRAQGRADGKRSAKSRASKGVAGYGKRSRSK
jgi:hypothetical protein